MQPRTQNILSAAIVVLLIIAGSLVNLSGSFFDFSPSTKEDDIFAVKALIAATGASITAAITLILFVHSNNNDQAHKSRLCHHCLVRGHDKGSSRAKKARANTALHAVIRSLVNDCAILAEMGGKSAAVPEAKWRAFRRDLEALHRNVARSAAELMHMLEVADYPDDRIRDDILAVLGLLGDAPSIGDDKRTVDTLRYRAVSKSLGPVLDRLGRRLDLAESRPPRRPGPVGEAGGMALRLDRDAYPPGAAIRATVEADGQFPHHKIIVTIHGEGPDALGKEAGEAPDRSLEQDASATARGAPEAAACAQGVREPEQNASVTMDVVPKKRLAAGQEYIARATCRGLHDEAVFAVEYMVPTVRADRRTCAMGDDIDVTVVDPAAAADIADKGAAGAAKRQCLIVGSHCDSIDVASRLRQEEHPAGTFRARVRCADAGAGDAGDDGIPCEPNQLICIRYKSAAGEAWTAVLVEGNGAASATAAGKPDRTSSEGAGGNGSGRPAGGGGSGEQRDTGLGPRGREGNGGRGQ